jgi:23S rRNA (cytidine1920-2'-O)/16S rRNA (cytidine1409-2'-O)-methyltransferase
VKTKKRLDILVVERGLAASRERAQRLILANEVIVNDEPCVKAGTAFSEDVVIRLRNPDFPYVSRGALKLLHALDYFKVNPKGRSGLDIGASTGGFTEVLLERGATGVTALDAGTNQLDWKIRKDERVRVLEKTNARYLKFEDLGQFFDVITVDVSFISLEKILPALTQFMSEHSDLITLVKPQFEVGVSEIGKGGIVRSEESRQRALERVRSFGETLSLKFVDHTLSPITGTDGNVEYLAHWKKI